MKAGTHVAGIIGAERGNGLGGGVANNVRIIAVKQYLTEMSTIKVLLC